ncbi:MAG: ABC transporter substrate-binding protein, partial [Anaerolineae bacterium]|nr:ABC transporter substrate-binding protein [Anaerolineae bacterium]
TVTQRIAGLQPFQPPRKLNRKISEHVEKVIIRAMELQVDRRFPDASSMLAELNGQVSQPQPKTVPYVQEHTRIMPQQTQPQPASLPDETHNRVKNKDTAPDTHPEPNKKRRKLWPIWVMGAGGIILILACIMGVWVINQLSKAEQSTQVTSTRLVAEATQTSEPEALLSTGDDRLVLPAGVLKFGSLDPVLSDWHPLRDQVASEVWVGLMRQNETTLAVGPGVADFWQGSNKATEWFFNLRSDIPWVHYNADTDQVERVLDEAGNIRYVSAADFAYGLKRMMQNPNSSHGVLNKLISEDSITVEGQSSLRITLTSPAGYFDVLMDRYAYAMPSWLIEEFGDSWTDPEHFQGYGPYILKSLKEGDALTLIRNPYWLATGTIPEPEIKEITWQIEDYDTLLTAFDAGEYDRIYVPSGVLTDVLQSDNYQPLLSAMSLGCVDYYEFNVREPPFDTAAARLAFSLATNRELILDKVYAESAPTMWYSPENARGGLAMSGEDIPDLAYDVEAAQKLLDQVYPDRSEIPTIYIAYNEVFGKQHTVAAEIRRQWEETFGVRVELRSYDTYSEYLEAMQSNPANVYRIGFCGQYNDAHAYFTLYDVMINLITRSGWNNVEFSIRIGEAEATTDQMLRNQLYARAEEILVKT